jgi:hypothetical protein
VNYCGTVTFYPVDDSDPLKGTVLFLTNEGRGIAVKDARRCVDDCGMRIAYHFHFAAVTSHQRAA